MQTTPPTLTTKTTYLDNPETVMVPLVKEPVHNFFPMAPKLPFSVVDQMAGAATRAPERSPHGLHKI